ncbi:hypothetical protein M444_34435 (plasmid) [Streptomyces sp. Mg1]|nr:hypothetical protein M444_34435 [Streptomyces sp. Mg1]
MYVLDEVLLCGGEAAGHGCSMAGLIVIAADDQAAEDALLRASQRGHDRGGSAVEQACGGQAVGRAFVAVKAGTSPAGTLDDEGVGVQRAGALVHRVRGALSEL